MIEILISLGGSSQERFEFIGTGCASGESTFRAARRWKLHSKGKAEVTPSV
jgi:hypothetical protein